MTDLDLDRLSTLFGQCTPGPWLVRPRLPGFTFWAGPAIMANQDDAEMVGLIRRHGAELIRLARLGLAVPA